MPHTSYPNEYAKCFGARCQPDGAVHFQLWSPSVNPVALVLGDPAKAGVRLVPMSQQVQGFYECQVPATPPGTLYGFQIIRDGNVLNVPDPASRYQPQDVHGPSCVIDSSTFSWQDHDWKGLPWERAVIYELHVGMFTPEGTFAALEKKLDYFVDLGVTAIELMPIADFPGARNWGYDGVLPFAPESRYGHPDDLRRLVQAAHAKGLMVFLDVVYNHFGPEGNYLHTYAEPFFTSRHKTPWGDAINFDDAHSEIVRSFFLSNALYWLEEFHFDGLRLDAVHAIADQSETHILEELAQAVRQGPGRMRRIHLVLENDDNAARFLTGGTTPAFYTAQWNDDIHHAFHVLVSGETNGYYADYADCPAQHLGRCLAEGFDYQGQPSPYRDGIPRGERSKGLPLTRFVSFIQNHDQVGNRAFGERLHTFSPPAKVRLAIAVYLLSPQIPMLFMGEEWASDQPFPFFCDFGPELAEAVRQGRRQEFAKFPEFRDPKRQGQIPDPGAVQTFESAMLDWPSPNDKAHQEWLTLYRHLIQLRHQYIIPWLSDSHGRLDATYTVLSDQALEVRWRSPEKNVTLFANFSDQPVSCRLSESKETVLIYETRSNDYKRLGQGQLPANTVVWLQEHDPV